MKKRANLEHILLGRLAPRAINQEGHEASNEALGHGHAQKTHFKEDLKAVLRSGIYAGGGFMVSTLASPFLGKSSAYLMKRAVSETKERMIGGLKGAGAGLVGGGAAGAGAAGLYAVLQAARGKPMGQLVTPLMLGGGGMGAGLGALTGGVIGTHRGGKKKESGNGR